MQKHNLNFSSICANSINTLSEDLPEFDIITLSMKIIEEMIDPASPKFRRDVSRVSRFTIDSVKIYQDIANQVDRYRKAISFIKDGIDKKVLLKQAISQYIKHVNLFIDNVYIHVFNSDGIDVNRLIDDSGKNKEITMYKNHIQFNQYIITCEKKISDILKTINEVEQSQREPKLKNQKIKGLKSNLRILKRNLSKTQVIVSIYNKRAPGPYALSNQNQSDVLMEDVDSSTHIHNHEPLLISPLQDVDKSVNTSSNLEDCNQILGIPLFPVTTLLINLGLKTEDLGIFS